MLLGLCTQTYVLLRDMYCTFLYICTYNAAFNENGVNFHAFSHRKTYCHTLTCSNSEGTFVAQYYVKREMFHAHYILLRRVSWPSGLAYRTQVLVLAAECGFESRSWHLCPWARHLTIIAPPFLRKGRKAVGPVCCVMHVKEPRTLIEKEKGLAPVFLEWQLNAPKLFAPRNRFL